jgi:hypothetical protein
MYAGSRFLLMFSQIVYDRQGLQGLQGWLAGQVLGQDLVPSQLNYRKQGLILQPQMMMWMTECLRDWKERHYD